MREIKFRVWDKKHKIALELMDIDFVNKLVECYRDNEDKSVTHAKFKINKVELMQFTGLKDKNGKEIYEGDIINKKGKKPIQVKWYKYLCMFNISPDSVRIYKEIRKKYEVIGNIYENPELLKEAKK